jgi:hypothetical protein
MARQAGERIDALEKRVAELERRLRIYLMGMAIILGAQDNDKEEDIDDTSC